MAESWPLVGALKRAEPGEPGNPRDEGVPRHRPGGRGVPRRANSHPNVPRGLEDAVARDVDMCAASGQDGRGGTARPVPASLETVPRHGRRASRALTGRDCGQGILSRTPRLAGQGLFSETSG